MMQLMLLMYFYFKKHVYKISLTCHRHSTLLFSIHLFVPKLDNIECILSFLSQLLTSPILPAQSQQKCDARLLFQFNCIFPWRDAQAYDTSWCLIR